MRSAVKPSPQRVLMTTDAVGGVFTYAVDLARGLRDAGVTTTLAVLGPSLSLDQQAQAEAVEGLELVVTGIALDWLAEDRSMVLAAGEAIAALARRVGADLVHLNSPALAASLAFDRPVVGVAHSCLATWWAAVRGGPLPEDFDWRTCILAEGYEATDVLIAPSAAFAAATRRLYPGAMPQVVHNGRRQPPPRASGGRQRCVITGGRLWDDGKNLCVLDAAAALLDAPVKAAGPPVGPQGVRVILDHIQPLGRLSEFEMAACLSQASVFASLALYEPFGLTVLEAAQAGCALVLSDIPTFRELWADVAIFVAPTDAAGAARAMQALLDDPQETARLGAAARRRAASFTLQAMTDGVLAVYSAALSRVPQEAVA